MPSTAMTIEKPSSTVMITSSWSIWSSCDLRNSAFVSTLACG